MTLADAGPASSKQKDFAAANSGRNRNAPESLFSFVQRLWHGYSLTQACGLEKEYLAGKSACHAAVHFNSLGAHTAAHGMKTKSANGRCGLLAGGNWIIDQVKIVDVYPQREQLANIRAQL